MTYRILDEPSPSRLAHLAVRPYWPLLALMLGGAWLGWPWFVFNSIALGSATARREQMLVGAALVASVIVALVIVGLVSAGVLDMRVARYVYLALVAIKLGTGYQLQLLQDRTVSLLEYFGSRFRNGIGVVIAGALVRGTLLELLPDLLVLVLA